MWQTRKIKGDLGPHKHTLKHFSSVTPARKGKQTAVFPHDDRERNIPRQINPLIVNKQPKKRVENSWGVGGNVLISPS